DRRGADPGHAGAALCFDHPPARRVRGPCHRAQGFGPALRQGAVMAGFSGEDRALFEAAEAVRAKAYAPYSGFSVGAAILADDGKIYSGCNVENAAYPQGNCAEPSAIAAMIAGGGKRIEKIFVTGPGVTPVTPCGGCRQRIREFAS